MSETVFFKTERKKGVGSLLPERPQGCCAQKIPVLFFPPKSPIEFSFSISQDQAMESNLPPDVLADMQYAVELAMNGKKDPSFEKRIQEEGKRIREEVFQKHGLLDIAVPAIRELRDEE